MLPESAGFGRGGLLSVTARFRCARAPAWGAFQSDTFAEGSGPDYSSVGFGIFLRRRPLCESAVRRRPPLVADSVAVALPRF